MIFPGSDIVRNGGFCSHYCIVTYLEMPGNAYLPVRMTRLPMCEVPARPVCAQMRASSSTVHEWPIWTRLSIFVPRFIRVSPIEALSMAVLAPISTSSSRTTRPVCGILSQCLSSSLAYPNPSDPMVELLWIKHRAPISLFSRTDTPECIVVFSPNGYALVNGDVRHYTDAFSDRAICRR